MYIYFRVRGTTSLLIWKVQHKQQKKEERTTGADRGPEVQIMDHRSTDGPQIQILDHQSRMDCRSHTEPMETTNTDASVPPTAALSGSIKDL